MQQINIKVLTYTNDGHLNLDFQINNSTLQTANVGSQLSEFDFSTVLNQGHHEFAIKMSGKMPEHTVLTDHGHIMRDRLLYIDDLLFDGVSLKKKFDLLKYTHDFNGHCDTVTETFHGILGCNGRVSLDFTMPLHFWMLENL